MDDIGGRMMVPFLISGSSGRRDGHRLANTGPEGKLSIEASRTKGPDVQEVVPPLGLIGAVDLDPVPIILVWLSM